MIELHTTATANGYRASIVLEECGLEYRAIAYDLTKGEHLRPALLAVNPVGRLPAIVDDAAAGGRAAVFGTQAIAQYLARKAGRFLPEDPVARAEVEAWAGFATSDLAPAYSGQFAFAVLAPERLAWGVEYYERLCARMLGVLDARLATRDWLAADAYSIADMLAYPAAAVSARRWPGDLDGYPHLGRWAARLGARPAVQRAMRVPG